MSNKFKDNIKRIVGEDRDTTVTPSLDEKGGIQSTRGIGSQTPGGKVTTQFAAVGDSADADNDGQTGETTLAQQTEDGMSPQLEDPLGGASGGFDADTGKVDAADFIDGTAGPSVKNSGPDNVSGSMLDSAVNAITAIDLDSGDEIVIRFDGLYEPIDATYWDDGTPRSSAWPDPTDPPELPGYEAGKWWEAQSSTYQDLITAFDMDGIGAGIVSSNFGAAGQTGGPGTLYGPNSFSNYYNFVSYDAVSATQYDVTMEQADSGGNPIGPTFTAFIVVQQDCITTPPTIPSTTCPAAAPLEDAWPDDDTILLTVDGGAYQPSQYDPDATVQYTGQNVSYVNLDLGSSRTGVLRKGRDGTNVLYENTGGSPIGSLFVIDNTGALVATPDASLLSNYVPRPTD